MWRDAIFFLSISSSLSASSCSSFTTGYPVDKELNWKNVLFSHPLHLLFLLLLQAFYHILIAIYSGSCSKYYRLNTVWQVSEQLVTADCTRKFVTTHLIMHRVASFYFFISILHQNETTSVFLYIFFYKALYSALKSVHLSKCIARCKRHKGERLADVVWVLHPFNWQGNFPNLTL